ncbi:MAG: hypothetical protein LPJ87_03330 [Zoogloeaceae bacterium]|nr:hypothetical protein [Zoogloeaceae bacterium]
MKKLILAATISLSATVAHASPGVMFGLNYNTTQGVGLSVNLLSSDRQDRFVGTVGTSYYPRTNRWGVDAGVGHTFKDGAATVSYDFLNQSPKFGVGYVDTKR